jgi:hypothetical protein
MISNASKRPILRSIHLIFAIPIIGYVYSPFAELPNTPPSFGLSPFLSLSFRNLDLRRRILRHHWRRGMARCILSVWNWGGYPESDRAIHRAEDLVGDSCATVEKIGLTRCCR